MGTNYYLTTKPCPDPCQHCTEPRRIHLGKSSGGWPFLFRGYPDLSDGEGQPRSEIGPVVSNYDEWCALADLGSEITDEYSRSLTWPELLAIVEYHHDRPVQLYEGHHLDMYGNRFSNNDFT